MSTFNTMRYRSVENSKNTSGESGNNPAGGSGQLTRAQIENLCSIAKEMGCTHYQTHLFMDTNAQMQANYSAYAANYNLFTLEQYTQLWSDVIHQYGMNHIMRGTWSAIKGNNNFAFATYPSGPNFVPLGTVAGASTEGETTYCGKMWRFMDTNVGVAHMADGDVLAPISEATEYLSNSNYIWFDTSSGTQAGLYTFFETMKQVVDKWAAANGKTLGYFTIFNYSELRSGYLNNTLPADQSGMFTDYYGHATHSVSGGDAYPSQYVADWLALYNAHGGNYPIYQTEMGGIWGDSWPTLGATPAINSPKITTYEDAAWYQIQFYQALRDNTVEAGIMNGMSNWGQWSGQNSSIVYYTNGTYKLNYMGQIYANFIKGNGMGRIPVQQEGSFNDDAWGGRSTHF